MSQPKQLLTWDAEHTWLTYYAPDEGKGEAVLIGFSATKEEAVALLEWTFRGIQHKTTGERRRLDGRFHMPTVKQLPNGWSDLDEKERAALQGDWFVYLEQPVPPPPS